MRSVTLQPALILFCLSYPIVPAAAAPSFSYQTLFQQGSADYSLYYDENHLESKVTMPQNQQLHSYTISLPVNQDLSWNLTWAASKTSTKGQGRDQDWQYDNPALWYDGSMTIYGRQTYWSVERKKTVSPEIKRFIQFSEYHTNNELKAVTYHITNFNNVGSQSQPDNGSQLNMTFRELAIGAASEKPLTNRLSVETSGALKAGHAVAKGYWANHTPAWQWHDDGFCWGYEASIGLKYDINRDTVARIGYEQEETHAPYASETLSTGSDTYHLTEQIALKQKRRSFYAGVTGKM